VASAYAINGRALLPGLYTNPWGSESEIPDRYRAQAAADLRKGGPVDKELGLGGRVRPREWTTILPYQPVGGHWVPAPGGIHGFGFLLLPPAVWTADARQVPGGGTGLDPFSPSDSLKVLACHLRQVEITAHEVISRLTTSSVMGPLAMMGGGLFQVQSLVQSHIQQIRSGIKAAAPSRNAGFPGAAWFATTLGVRAVWNAARSVLGGNFLDQVAQAFAPDVQAALAPVAGLTAAATGYQPSALAQQDIPPAYLALFQKWGAQYGIDWTVLAGVGKVETDFGRAALPGVSSGTNWAGAGGPMQFEAATFDRYHVAASGSPPDLYDPGQAIAAAAAYLAALGMTDPAQEQSALCHYNAGSGSAYQACMVDPNSYAAQVLNWARQFRGAAQAVSGTIAGSLPWPQLPLTDPVGTRTPIPTIAWPAGAADHANPNAVTNQCVAGALWTWGVMHASDPRWKPPPPLAQAMAWEEFGAAQQEGFQTTGPDQPVVGSMVVYASGWGGSGAGHIATVIAVSGSKFEVVEQNVVAVSESLVPAWNVFDVRIDQAGSPGIEGFIVAPPG
ncbi:MAG: CHAP domain-containing protein, partial [Candidatus Dormibacteraeota bacterium]|nr:CHAP domain-containing protein [Candidatus Dormibacteraeota bacterium]